MTTAGNVESYERMLQGAETMRCCYHLVDANGTVIGHELMSESVVLDSESDCRFCLGTGRILVDD